MRFAAVADVHGNSAALEAVLADIAGLGVDDIVNLGDHVSGPMDAPGAADILMRRDFPSILGDQDRRLLDLYEKGSDASDRVDFQSLRSEHFEWMAKQPETLLFRDEVVLCHGSPRGDAVYWLDRVCDDGSIRLSTIDEIEADAEGIEASLILCAHTHLPRLVRLRDGRVVVNPGSVGLPAYKGLKPVEHVVQTGTPDACYAVLERTTEAWRVTFRYVPYDPALMVRLCQSNSKPDWANAVETGWLSPGRASSIRSA